MSVYTNRFRELSRKAQAGVVATVLTLTGAAPILLPASALAAPTLTERELQSTTAQPSTATTLTWVFDTTADTANVDHIEIEFCDSPLSACGAGTENGSDNTTVAADNIPILPASPTATLTNFVSSGNSASRTGGDSGATSNQILIDKTTADAGASINEGQISIGGFTNDESANKTFYTRMRMYSDTGTTLVWEGVFAQSTSQTLTVNARVQERLDFCVGSTTVDDATTSVGAACSNVTGNTVDIGNIESGFTNVSPVDVSNGGTDVNGVAMVRTNAVNGAVVDYKSLQNTSSGKLKVAGATCSGTSTTDQCFNSSSTQGVFAAGTENFGMTIAAINCGSSTAYSCTFGTGVYNLVRDGDYDGTGGNTYLSENNLVSGSTTGGYAWLDSGVADRIASSAGSTVKVIDDEAMILKFAGTAGITTPTGAYTVQADFIVTATF